VSEVTITRLGHLGDGIGDGPRGAAVYAARTLPGEVVAGEIEGDRIETPGIVTPSPERVGGRPASITGAAGAAR
jgi:23S rRNA (uracil1939-C5)-methyltransferase